MARQVRIEFPCAFYHVMARGNHFEPLFHNENVSDQELFLKKVDEACERYQWRVWAWVLMKKLDERASGMSGLSSSAPYTGDDPKEDYVIRAASY